MTKIASAEVGEGVRATIALYVHALDDGRVDDTVATFCADGVIELPGMGTYAGHDALRDAYTQWVPRGPQRHLVLNTVVMEDKDGQATAVSDVVFMTPGKSGWVIHLVGRYNDTLHYDAGSWRFHHRVATFVATDG